jgi:hypothetical protein
MLREASAAIQVNSQWRRQQASKRRMREKGREDDGRFKKKKVGEDRRKQKEPFDILADWSWRATCPLLACPAS